MTTLELSFFIIGSLMIFYTSILEYINLNNFSKKDIFKNEHIYNKDLLAARIYGLLHFTEQAKYYLYPYLWTMISLSIVGTIFIFKDSFVFNILTITLIGFFYMQYKNFIFKIALNMEDKNIPFTYTEIYKQLDKEDWTVKYEKIKLKEFSKETLDKFGFESKEYGNININSFVNLKDEPELSKFKYEDDILFRDDNGNIYDVLKEGKKPGIRRISLGFSNLFSALNKEENINKKMLLSVLEAGTSSFVLYLSIIGFNLKII